jgi:hypothetical protein
MDAISTKSQWHIGSTEDYVRGWAAGKIEGMFGGYFAYTFGTEHAEITLVMFKRSADT